MNRRAHDDRLRGRPLQRIRRSWFMRHPLCVRCKAKGIVSLATELDHIVSLGNGGPDFDKDNETNRQGLCDACHLEKTAEDMGYTQRSGSDASGLPLDPDHPWNKS